MEGFGIALYLKCKVRAKEFNARIRATARRRQDPAIIGGIFVEGTVCLLIVCEGVNAMTGFFIVGAEGSASDADASC